MFIILVLVLVVTLIILFDDTNIDECLRNNEETEDNDASFSLHDTSTNYLFYVC
jgi:hypothetical protein